MATIPLLVVLSALHPVGTRGNFGVQLSRYLGLSGRATRDLEAVFAGRAEVRGAVTTVGLIVLGFFALGVAQAHQRAYELAWRLPGREAGAWRCRLRWIAGLLASVALLAIAGRVIAHWSAPRVAFIALCAPATALFYWWSQWTLLARRVAAHSLIPGAAIIAGAITGMLVVTPWLISGQVTSSVREFGPIGVTLVVATWLLIVSTLVVTGALAGAVIASNRTAPAEGRRVPVECAGGGPESVHADCD
jgi:membrane protein